MTDPLYSLDSYRPARFGSPVVIHRKGARAAHLQVFSGEPLSSKVRRSNRPIKIKLRKPAARNEMPAGSADSLRFNRAATSIYRKLPVSRLKSHVRQIQIVTAAVYYYSLSTWAWFLNAVRIRRADSRQRNLANARRLREIVEWLGGGFVKVGQQLALRSDLMPPEFCDELDHLFDNHAPFPVEQAIAAIERSLGRSLSAVFREFERKPIGSASLACVYRAVLLNGEQVAVKVRRPGIEALFAADIAALGFVAWFLELLTFYRQRFFENVLTELRNIALEETDFRSEARYQELFRKYHKRRKELKVTAHKVYFELSGEDVLVTQFVHGIPLKDILLALDTNDTAFLNMLKQLSIDPETLAKHLIRSRSYSFYECPFFHGDPHPGNIFVQPRNRMVMIDFGACGVFSEKDRRLMLRINELYARADVSGMVDCVLGLTEPLPLADIDRFRKELLDEWWKGYYGLQSKHAQWWERTSVRLWIALLQLFGDYQISMPAHMIRMIRATLLYDTVAAKLYPKINVFAEFNAYLRGAGRAAERGFLRCAERRLLTGPDPTFFVQLQDAIRLGRDIFFRMKEFVAQSEVGFVAVMDKVYFAIDGAVNLVKVSATVAVLWALIYFGGKLFGLFGAHGLQIKEWSTSLRILAGVAGFLILLNVFSFLRHTMARWRDKDNYSDRSGVTV